MLFRMCMCVDSASMDVRRHQPIHHFLPYSPVLSSLFHQSFHPHTFILLKKSKLNIPTPHNTGLMGTEMREENSDEGRQAGERKHTYSPPSTADIHTCPPTPPHRFTMGHSLITNHFFQTMLFNLAMLDRAHPFRWRGRPLKGQANKAQQPGGLTGVICQAPQMCEWWSYQWFYPKVNGDSPGVRGRSALITDPFVALHW